MSVSTDLWYYEQLEVIKSAYYYSMDVKIYYDLTDDPLLGSLVYILEQVQKKGLETFREKMDPDEYKRVLAHGHDDVKAILHVVNSHHICVRFEMIHCGCGEEG